MQGCLVITLLIGDWGKVGINEFYNEVLYSQGSAVSHHIL